MLLKIMRIAGAGIAGVALAQSAMAQEGTGTSKIETDADSVKIGAALRAEYQYKDDGLKKVAGSDDPAGLQDIGLSAAYLSLSGKVNPKTEFALRANLLPALKLDPSMSLIGDDMSYEVAGTSDVLNYGYLSHWFTDVVGVSFGKMKVLQGGWANYLDNGYGREAHIQGPLTSALVYPKFKGLFAVHVKAAGQLTLQVFDDIYKGGNEGNTEALYNANSHPTVAVGWVGKFGGVEPLVNVGSFDNNKSYWLDLGVRANLAGVDATFDYNRIANVAPTVGTDGATEDAETVKAGFTVSAAYTVPGVVTPFLYFSSLDRDEPGNDVDVNTTETTEGSRSVSLTVDLDDNAFTYGGGVDVLSLGENYTPFLAVIGRTGKFQKALDTTGTEERSDLTVKVGVYGSI